MLRHVATYRLVVILLGSTVLALFGGKRCAAAALPTPEEVYDSPRDLWAEAALKQPGGPTYEFFRDLLDEYFTEAELQRQLETAISWGRYAELFDYDADQKRFFLPEAEAVEPTGEAR